MKIIGIAGGSGSGKSTLAIGLYHAFPGQCAIIHLDDYFKSKAEVPTLDDYTNWDHPDALDWDKLYQDILDLKNGKSIIVSTKSELYHPNYNHSLRNKIDQIIDPRPIVILEGYLLFHDKRIRDMLDTKIFLDMPIESSSERRSLNKFTLNPVYINSILFPMHKKFVQPTKEYAEIIIDASQQGPKEVLEIVFSKLNLEVKNDRSFGIIPVCKDTNGNFLFCLVKHAAGHWAFPKGHQDSGETVGETALRELKEETGIDSIEIIPDSSLIEQYSFEEGGILYQKTVTYFVGMTSSTNTMTMQEFAHEISDIRWVSYDEARELLTFPEAKSLLDKAMEILKK